MTQKSIFKPGWTVIDSVAGELETAEFSINAMDEISLDNGTGASQADRWWSDSRTLTTGATEELDLNTLTDAVGRLARNLKKIKAIRIYNLPGNTTDLTIGNAAATQFQGGFGAVTQTWTIPPGGWFDVGAPVNGWDSTTAVADKLKIANAAGASNTYYIYAVGTSA